MKARSTRWAAVIIGLVALAVAWLASGDLALIVVLVVELLIVSYRWQRRGAGWRSGRPTRQRRLQLDDAIAAQYPGRDRPEPDPVGEWIRERSLYDLFDDREDGSSGSAGNGA